MGTRRVCFAKRTKNLGGDRMEPRIKFHIDGPIEPPKVFIDETAYPVVSIEYNYETRTHVGHGVHRLLVEYIGEGGKNASVYVGFDSKE